jgi:hypothetical protein
MRDVGKDSFVRSMEIRRDEVYSRILQEMFTMDNFISRKIKVVYHRNCYFSHVPVVINSFQNKIVTIQHANQSIIILTKCALHQLVHTLTGCNFMYIKIFLECFILQVDGVRI